MISLRRRVRLFGFDLFLLYVCLHCFFSLWCVKLGAVGKRVLSVDGLSLLSLQRLLLLDLQLVANGSGCSGERIRTRRG